MGKYRLTPQAETDRDCIVEYTMREHGERQCAIYVDELEACFERIGDFPGLGQGCGHIRAGYRCFPIGEHNVYYRVEDDGVVIVRVRDQRRRKAMLDEGSTNP